MQAGSAAGEWAVGGGGGAGGECHPLESNDAEQHMHVFGLPRLCGDADSSGGSSASPPPLLPLSSCGDSSPSSPPLFAAAPPAWPHGSAAPHAYHQSQPSRCGSGSGGSGGGSASDERGQTQRAVHAPPPSMAPLTLQTGAWMIQQPSPLQSHPHHLLLSPQADPLGSPPSALESPRGSSFAMRLPMLPLPSPSPPLSSVVPPHPASAFRPPDQAAHQGPPQHQHYQQARWDGAPQLAQYNEAQMPMAAETTSEMGAAAETVASLPLLGHSSGPSPPAASFAIQRPAPLSQRLGASEVALPSAPQLESESQMQMQLQLPSPPAEVQSHTYPPSHHHLLPPPQYWLRPHPHPHAPPPTHSPAHPPIEPSASCTPPPEQDQAQASRSLLVSWRDLAPLSQLHLHEAAAPADENSMLPLMQGESDQFQLSSPQTPLPPPAFHASSIPVEASASAVSPFSPAAASPFSPSSSGALAAELVQGQAHIHARVAPSCAAGAGAAIATRTTAKKKKAVVKSGTPRLGEPPTQSQEHKARLARESRLRKKEYTQQLEKRLAEHERLLQLLLNGRSEQDEDARPLAAQLEAELVALAALPKLVSPHQQSSSSRTPTHNESAVTAAGADTSALSVTSPKQLQLRRSSLSSTPTSCTPPHPSTPTLHGGCGAGVSAGHPVSSPSPVSAGGGGVGPSSRLRVSSSRASLPSALDEVALSSPLAYNSHSASPGTPAMMHSSLPYQAQFHHQPSRHGRHQHSGPSSLSASTPLHHTSYSPHSESSRQYAHYSRASVVRPGSADHGQLAGEFALPASRQMEQSRIVSEPAAQGYAQQQQQQRRRSQNAHGASAHSGPTSRVRSRAETPLDCPSPVKRGRHDVERASGSWSAHSASLGVLVHFGQQAQSPPLQQQLQQQSQPSQPQPQSQQHVFSQGPLARQVSELVPGLTHLAMTTPTRDDDEMRFELPPASQHFHSQAAAHSWNLQAHAHEPSAQQQQQQPQQQPSQLHAPPQLLFPSPDPPPLPLSVASASSSSSSFAAPTAFASYGAPDGGRALGSWMAAGSTSRLQLSDATPTESMNSIFSSPHTR